MPLACLKTAIPACAHQAEPVSNVHPTQATALQLYRHCMYAAELISFGKAPSDLLIGPILREQLKIAQSSPQSSPLPGFCRAGTRNVNDVRRLDEAENQR